MTKKIHTIQSSDKNEFDKQVNQLLEVGGELMDGGYEVINNDDGVVYSQVIVFKNNCEVEYWGNGLIKKCVKINEKGYKNGLSTSWYENGQKELEGTYKDGECDGLTTWWYGNGQKIGVSFWKDGKEVSSKEWNEDGSVKE